MLRGLTAVAVVTMAAMAALPVAAQGAAGAVHISTEPALFPDFAPNVHDYTTRCVEGAGVDVQVTATSHAKVAVDGGQPRAGSFSSLVAVTTGQSFDLRVHGRGVGGGTAYHVRCLPPDFPAFTATRSGRPQAQWYIVAPFSGAMPPGISLNYVAVFDTNGVPVWWYRADTQALDAKLLSNGHIVWLPYNETEMLDTAAEEHRFDGSLVRRISTVGGGADHHEIQLLNNGNYLLARYPLRFGVDLTGCGGLADGTIYDSELQEITPEGLLKWSWHASEHIPPSEVSPRWSDQCAGAGPKDIYHFNSAEPDGSGIVISLRHLDAVLRISRRTGNIDWKLGGRHRPQSLRVIGDPLFRTGGFAGQHDARILPDGTLTVHDDGTRASRAPRAVRYRINRRTRTATLLEDVRDAAAQSSFCCGSARRLAGGNWVTAWGGLPLVSELTPAGSPVFRLTFTQNLFSYRADPVPFGRLSAATLRDGMNTMHPRP